VGFEATGLMDVNPRRLEPRRRSVGSARQGVIVGYIHLTADDRYLDTSPMALLIGATILVALLVLSLVAQKAAGWFRGRR
jgi:hypothetical protein